MRPIHPHAAESGVGKHIARESESAKACAAGKERVANAHPQKLALEASKLPEPFFCPNLPRQPWCATAAVVKLAASDRALSHRRNPVRARSPSATG